MHTLRSIDFPCANTLLEHWGHALATTENCGTELAVRRTRRELQFFFNLQLLNIWKCEIRGTFFS